MIEGLRNAGHRQVKNDATISRSMTRSDMPSLSPVLLRFFFRVDDCLYSLRAV
jgi:hypothetical protein